MACCDTPHLVQRQIVEAHAVFRYWLLYQTEGFRLLKKADVAIQAEVKQHAPIIGSEFFHVMRAAKYHADLVDVLDHVPQEVKHTRIEVATLDGPFELFKLIEQDQQV